MVKSKTLNHRVHRGVQKNRLVTLLMISRFLGFEGFRFLCLKAVTNLWLTVSYNTQAARDLASGLQNFR